MRQSTVTEVPENTMTANKVFISVITFALLAKAYVILTS
jgi:hypothetical protein